MKHNLTEGQEVFLSIPRKGFHKELIRTKITKVGRKYFEIEYFSNDTNFLISSLTENTDSAYKKRIFLKESDFQNMLEKERISKKLNGFRFENLTLENLKQIEQIIENHG